MSIPIGLAQMVAAAAVFWLPGLALLAALGMKGRMRTAALAPAVTIGVLAACSMAAALVGVRWNLLVATACVAVVAGSAALLRRRLAQPGAAGRIALRTSMRTNRHLVAVVAAVVLLQLGVVAQALFVRDRLPNTWDSTFHFNALQYVRLLGVADPATFGSLADSSGATPFYPSGWHAVAALVPVWLGTTTTMAAVSYVPVAIAWTIGLAALAREVVPAHGVAVPALAAGMAVSGLATPLWVALHHGMLPNAMGIALVPGAAAVFVATVRERSLPHRPITWVAWAVGAFGVGACHPGALAGLILVVLPWCGSAVLAWWRAGRARSRAIGATVLVASLAAVASFVARDGLVNVVRDSDSEGGPMHLGGALLGLATGQTAQSATYAIIPAVLALVAMGGRIRRHEDLRPIIAWGLIAVVYLLAVTNTAWADPLTGLFYGEGRRIGPVLAVWTSVLAADGLARTSRLIVRRIEVPARLGASGSAALLAGVVLVVSAVPSLVTWRGVAASVYTTDISSTADDQSQNPYFTLDELAMARRLPQELPPGSRVLGSGFSGASHLYGLVGIDVQPFYLQPPADLRTAVVHFHDLETDPSVCAALRKYGVTHVYADPLLSKGLTFPYASVPFSDLPSSGLRLVDKGGTAAVYAITACGS
ncbi:MAG TPA: DUF6541 family protein [Cellulomonas sp.]